jgi:hypothetical protein
MIIEHEDTLVSSEIFSTRFVCNLTTCKGACCIEGDRGAPVEKEEVKRINDNLAKIMPYMTAEGIALLNEEGFHEGEEIDDIATTCLPTGECVFVYRENGILGCAIEKSYKDGQSDFYKPISCHLYPIRIGKLGKFESLNYHKWDICKAACALGQELNIPVFKFLKDPLIRKFGEAWFVELEEIYQEYLLLEESRKGDF